MTGATLVVGVGRERRGDDGVGPAVARVVASSLPPATSARVVVEADPTELLDLWEGHEHVVLIDAVVTGDPPGTLHRLEIGAEGPPLSPSSWSLAGLGGTHAFGVAAVVELGRALSRLPALVTVIGVEAGRLEIGTTLSPTVATAVDAAVALVLEEVVPDVSGGVG